MRKTIPKNWYDYVNNYKGKKKPGKHNVYMVYWLLNKLNDIMPF